MDASHTRMLLSKDGILPPDQRWTLRGMQGDSALAVRRLAAAMDALDSVSSRGMGPDETLMWARRAADQLDALRTDVRLRQARVMDAAGHRDAAPGWEEVTAAFSSLAREPEALGRRLMRSDRIDARAGISREPAILAQDMASFPSPDRRARMNRSEREEAIRAAEEEARTLREMWKRRRAADETSMHLDPASMQTAELEALHGVLRYARTFERSIRFMANVRRSVPADLGVLHRSGETQRPDRRVEAELARLRAADLPLAKRWKSHGAAEFERILRMGRPEHDEHLRKEAKAQDARWNRSREEAARPEPQQPRKAEPMRPEAAQRAERPIVSPGSIGMLQAPYRYQGIGGRHVHAAMNGLAVARAATGILHSVRKTAELMHE